MKVLYDNTTPALMIDLGVGTTRRKTVEEDAVVVTDVHHHICLLRICLRNVLSECPGWSLEQLEAEFTKHGWRKLKEAGATWVEYSFRRSEDPIRFHERLVEMDVDDVAQRVLSIDLLLTGFSPVPKL